MSNEIKEKEEYEKYARDHRKELDAQEVKLGDVVTVLVGHFAGEKGVIVGMIACDKSDYADPYYEIEMECDVPEEFRVRKTLIGQSRVIGGVERRYLKVIGNRAPKQPSMEIKQGDKVKVSKDAPEMYFFGCNHDDSDYKVILVDRDNAVITQLKNGSFAIPTKYLVKVDAEAFRLADIVSDAGLYQDNYLNEDKKEAEFKVGDKVRMKDGYYKEELHGCIGTIRKIDKCHIYIEIDSTIYSATIHSIELYTEPTVPKVKIGDRVEELVSRKSGIVLGIEGDIVVVGVPYDKEKHRWHIDSVELVSPTEQTETEETFDDQIRDVLNGVEHQDYGHPIQTAMINLNINDWDAYAAALAKEVALKVANKFNTPEQAAEYAVSVAKAVAEGLKRG